MDAITINGKDFLQLLGIIVGGITAILAARGFLATLKETLVKLITESVLMLTKEMSEVRQSVALLTAELRSSKEITAAAIAETKAMVTTLKDDVLRLRDHSKDHNSDIVRLQTQVAELEKLTGGILREAIIKQGN